MRNLLIGLLAMAGLVAGIIAGATASPAADHLEAPLVQEDGRLDINDVYAFASPTNPDNTVLVMTVNPAAGLLSPTTLHPDAMYRFVIDQDGDFKGDTRIAFRFGAVKADGTQEMRVLGGVTKGYGETFADTELRRGGRAYVGTLDDPFFFDFQAFQDQVKGAGGSRTFCDGHEVDFFEGFDTTAIVVEVPSRRLTGDLSTVNIWGETRIDGVTIDRMGKPAIATALINDGSEDTYNMTSPHKTYTRFRRQVADNLFALSGLDGSGYTKRETRAIAQVLLPDVLTYDTAAPADYSTLNGRALDNDVMDFSLFVVTGGLGENGSAVLDSDCVDANDNAFSTSFPYLAPANSGRP